MKKYQQIKTKEDYMSLLNSGMFFEFHPELTGEWEKDKEVINSGIKTPDDLLSLRFGVHKGDNPEMVKVIQEYHEQ